MTERGKNFLTLLFATTVMLLIIEGGLRLFEYKDFSAITELNADGYMVHKPYLDRPHFDEEVGKKVHIKTNSNGFVGGDFVKQKEDGVLRVAVLGDSFTEASQIDYEKSFAYLLRSQVEDVLMQKAISSHKRAEVLNFGLGGIGTAYEMKYYSKYVREYRPDVVVVSFYLGNDVSDNGYYYVNKDLLLSTSTANWDKVPQYGVAQDKEFVAWKDKIYRASALVRFVDKAVRSVPMLSNVAVSLGLYRQPVSQDEAGLNLPFWDYYYLDPLDEVRSSHLAFSSDLINNLKRQVEADGSQFVLMLIPEGKTVDAQIFERFKNDHPKLKEYNFNPIGMEERLVSGLHADVHVLNLRSVLQKEVQTNRQMYNAGIHHFSADGHQVVARMLAEFIGHLF